VRQVIAGVRTWSVFAEDRGLHFNGFAVETSEGTLLVDPVDRTRPGRSGASSTPSPHTWRSTSRTATTVGRRASFGAATAFPSASTRRTLRRPSRASSRFSSPRVVGDLVVGEGGELAPIRRRSSTTWRSCTARPHSCSTSTSTRSSSATGSPSQPEGRTPCRASWSSTGAGRRPIEPRGAGGWRLLRSRVRHRPPRRASGPDGARRARPGWPWREAKRRGARRSSGRPGPWRAGP
jgi:hypothetical protein